MMTAEIIKLRHYGHEKKDVFTCFDHPVLFLFEKFILMFLRP